MRYRWTGGGRKTAFRSFIEPSANNIRRSTESFLETRGDKTYRRRAAKNEIGAVGRLARGLLPINTTVELCPYRRHLETDVPPKYVSLPKLLVYHPRGPKTVYRQYYLRISTTAGGRTRTTI